MQHAHHDQLLESLEPRALLSTFVVTNTNDTGAGSLRQMISDANNAAGADVIEFDSSLDGATIGLTSGQISITGELTINGLGEDRLEISGQRISRVFGISPNASVSMSDLTIKWGQQDNGLGGQIYVDQDASLTLTSVTLHDSQALWGGAIYNNFGSLTLNGCTVSEGKAFRHGGGIDSNGLLTIIDSSFVNNFASIDGGAIHGSGGYDGVADISGSTFSGNVAAEDGGAIANLATMIIKNSTISGNQAYGAGGAINNWYTLSLTIYNSTIVNNTASDTGGIVNIGTTATLYSTILSLNTGGDHTPGTVDGSNNYLGGDPLLEPLADNGGPTLTRELPDISPAAGQGSNPLGLQFDQRGDPYARSWDGSIDIGAFQRQPPPPLALVVDTVADENDGDYSAGDLSLREAIGLTNANPGSDSISFDPSLDAGMIILDSGSITISGGLTLDGSNAPSLRIFAAADSRIFLVDDGDPNTNQTVSIRSLRLREGGGYNGGVIYNAETLSLVGISITGSTTAGDGGAIYNAESGTLTLSNSTLDGNDAAQHGADGGAIYNLGSATIESSTISNNQALGGDDNVGGGIYNGPSGDLTIIGSQITNNFTIIAGGGIENLGTLTITDSTVADNLSFSGSGGGIDNYGGLVTITGSTLSGNAAGESGGAIWTDSTLIIRNSTLSANRAEGYGGAIGMFDGEVTVQNSTIAYNVADSDQVGSETGGGIDVGRREGSGVLTTISTIWASNTTGSGAPSDITTTNGTVSASSTNNLVTSTSTAGGIRPDVSGNIVGSDPLLGPLADNGGLTLTHALLTGSPAIDAGANPAGLQTDQRGQARSFGDSPDIGAFESQESQGGGGGGGDGGGGGGGDDGFSVDVITGGALRTTAVAGGTTISTARNTDGELIVFTGSGSAWTVLRLTDHTSAPAATGDPIVWTDPNDGLAYVAAPSAGGFLLFRRATDGAWTYRDIAGAAGDPTDRPSDSLAYFVTRPRSGSPLVYIVGSNDAGELVAYFQTSASQAGQQASWSFYNITDDLASQNMSTPEFSASPTTYVTSWNQWTIAGLDAQGHVQGVWVNVATFTAWRVDDLSSITGADPLAGRLDVTLTPWGGIRFAGSNAAGHLVGTWWNPGRGPGNWTQTDMTNQVPANAPTLAPGHLTAWFVGSNNMISYAGYDDGGDIVSLYWQPGDGGVWNADNLTDSLENRSSRPARELNAYVSSTGEISITGAAPDGSAVRLWALDGSRDFLLQNLSDLATRI